MICTGAGLNGTVCLAALASDVELEGESGLMGLGQLDYTSSSRFACHTAMVTPKADDVTQKQGWSRQKQLGLCFKGPDSV